MDNTSQLINYIVQELKRGVPEASIRSILVQNGWPTDAVDHAFEMLRQNEPGVSPSTSAAELPTVSGVRPVLQPVQNRPEAPVGRKRKLVGWLLALAISVLLAAGVFSLATDPEQQTPDNDSRRKNTFSTLADKLAAHYAAKDTYPTISELNNPAFAAAKDGFDITRYADPAWSSESTACKDKEGRAILAASRAAGCYAYRTTTLNGDDCDGKAAPCSRAVLTATLDSGKPYLIILDQNQREEY